MAYAREGGFRGIIWLVLVVFYVQTLNPVMLGYAPWQGSPTRTETAGPSVWQRLLDFALPAAQAATPAKPAQTSVVFVQRTQQTYKPAYAQPQANGDPLLASTPEFDLADPYLVAKANELGKDPQRIFAFVRDEIGFESYVGSLRGARGALWSNAGNALDQASLLIALLRISGIPARYAQGTLAKDKAQELIASMFLPAPYRVVGFVPDGAEKSDPVNDPALIAEAQQHFWVEFQQGGAFVAADPAFRSAQLGQTFTAASGQFAEVPDNLRHKVTVRLQAETGGNAFDVDLQKQKLLDYTFTSAELVGKPLSIGHFVNSSAQGGLIGANYTHTYSPYILVGQNDGNIEDDPIIRGQDYQEFISSIFGALANSVVTGVFLEMDVIQPGGQKETFERALVDRIGFAARNSSGETNLKLDLSSGQTAISPVDIFSLHIESGVVSATLRSTYVDQFNKVKQALIAIFQKIQNQGDNPSEQDVNQAQQLMLSFALLYTQSTNNEFSQLSNLSTNSIANIHLIKAYFNKPRIILSSSETVDSKQIMKMDIIRNNIRVFAFPEQSLAALITFNVSYGIVESINEDFIASSNIQTDNNAIVARVSVHEIFRRAKEQGIELTILDKSKGDLLKGFDFSEEAKIRISQALEQGKIVLTPNKSVQVNNEKTISWFVIDLATGSVTDTAESGGHQIIDTALLNKYLTYTAQFIGAFVAGFGAGTFGGLSLILCASNSFCSEYKKRINTAYVDGIFGYEVAILLDKFVEETYGITFSSGYIQGAAFVAGYIAARSLFEGIYINPSDPDLPPILVGLPATMVESTTQPLSVKTETLFTLPTNSTQLASLYRLHIQNTGPAAATYRVTFPNQPAGFTVKSSLPEVTIPAGETGVVGIMLIPNAGLPAPGTQTPFQVTITDTATNQTQTTPTTTFTTPDVVGITLDAAPTQTTTAPGGTVNATLTVKSVGNVAAPNIPLTLEASTGLSVSGLPATVSLALGETQTIPLTLTASGALNDTLTATITASYGQDLDGNPYQASATLAVSVRSAETLPLERCAQTAASAQNAQLAQNLAGLAEVTAQLQQKPGDAALCGRATLLYDQLLQLADVNPGLTALKPQIQALRNLAAACNTPQLLTDSAQFFTNNCAVQAVSATPAVSLIPTSVTLEPGQGTTFHLRLENQGAQPATFNLSLALPAGVTATLNRSSVTLGAGEVLDASSANPVTLTLSQTPTTAQTFAVRVLAALAGTSTTLTASGLVRIAPAQADVVSVTANPVVIDQTQTTTTVTAQILNAANLTRSALAQLQVLDSTGTVVQTLPTVAVNLVPSTETIPVNLGTVGITGLNEGIYRLRVSLLTTTNTPIPGRSAETLLFVGMPITATVRAEPALVAPGNPTVKTVIEVSNRLDEARPFSLPKLEWSWTSSNVESDALNVLMTPAIIDLNGDGVPDVVFGSTSLTGGTQQIGVLRALSGRDGKELFTVTDPTLLINVMSSVAVGDIDLDGLPEIIACDDSFSRLIAFENDGTFKWRTDTLEWIDWGAPALADLDGNGVPEIVVGRQVLDNKGALLWTGTEGRGDSYWGPLSLVADLNLDGKPEVVAGNTAYSPDGSTLWHTSDLPDGFNAVANFDNDPFAEVVLVSGGYVWLLEHDGSIAWGPVPIPEGGTGGPPTVADFDGDGKPEIGVAGATKYVVLESDGTVKWTATTQDATSNVTGSSVFDFNGDGAAEVIYRDELFLRVYRGHDGQILFETPMSSSTWYEYILVADVDADNQAEIIAVANNNNEIGPQRGVYVFGSSDVPWANTRRIWNQHTYHITNVNEDGTIPRVEQNNWQTPGLNNYRLNTFAPGEGRGLDLQVTHRLPASGYTVDPNTISPVAGTVAAEQIVWRAQSGINNPTATFQLTGAVPNLSPGESRAISTGTDIIATYTGSNGQPITVTLPLPPVVIAAAHILTLDPASRTVVAGQSVGYNVILANPTSTDQTYTLGLIGLEDLNATLAGSITVPAGQTVTTPLTVGPPASTPTTSRAFAVTATTSTGGVSTAPGELLVTNTSTGTGTPPPTITLPGQAVDITLIPTVATAGLGTAATFVARVTNLGDATTTFNLTGAFPAGFTAALGETSVTLLPGLSGYRDVAVTLTPPTGTNPSDYPFTVSATAAGAPTVTDQAAGTVRVVNLGVDVDLTPDTANPPATLSLKVTNTGRVQETYTLELAGPAAQYTALPTATVTLAPGASQTLTLNVGAITTALPGDLTLTAIATAQSNSSVRDSDTSRLGINPSRGLEVAFDPNSQTLPAPGPAAFLMRVRNTGNREEAYQAVITTTNGPVSAALEGLDGQPTQRIATFRLPALATGLLTLDTTLQQIGTGKVTVTVNTLDAPALTDADTATVNAQNQLPGGDSTAIPTLNEWMQLLMALLMLLALAWASRRRYHR